MFLIYSNVFFFFWGGGVQKRKTVIIIIFKKFSWRYIKKTKITSLNNLILFLISYFQLSF